MTKNDKIKEPLVRTDAEQKLDQELFDVALSKENNKVRRIEVLQRKGASSAVIIPGQSVSLLGQLLAQDKIPFVAFLMKNERNPYLFSREDLAECSRKTWPPMIGFLFAGLEATDAVKANPKALDQHMLQAMRAEDKGVAPEAYRSAIYDIQTVLNDLERSPLGVARQTRLDSKKIKTEKNENNPT